MEKEKKVQCRDCAWWSWEEMRCTKQIWVEDEKDKEHERISGAKFGRLERICFATMNKDNNCLLFIKPVCRNCKWYVLRGWSFPPNAPSTEGRQNYECRKRFFGKLIKKE